MKKIILSLIIAAFIFIACDRMEDNYIDYLHNVKVYSPAIVNLRHVDSYRTVELMWDNPQSDIIEKIRISWDIGETDTAIVIPQIVDTYIMKDLDIRGYTISVFTIDKYGNLSIPRTVNAFPSGTGDIEE
jgi:hypothetical protein